MKRLDRYVLSLFGAAFVSAVVVLAGLYVLLHFVSHVKDLEEAAAAFAERDMSLTAGIARYYALNLPEIVVLFGPYATLLAGMYAIHQLNQNNELVVMFAIGVSRFRVAVPILLCGMLISLALATVKERVIPVYAAEMVTIQRFFKGKSDTVFRDLPLLTDSYGNVFVCDRWNVEEERLESVWFQPRASTQSVYFPYIRWNRHGTRAHWEAPEDAIPEDAQLLAATDLEPADLELEQRTRNRQSFVDLRRIVDRKPERNDLKVLMHSHATYPLTALVLLLLGLPLVIRTRNRNVFAGLALCFVLSLSFFATNLVLQRLGAEAAVIGPVMGAWLPILVFGAIGVVVFELTST